MTFVKDLPLCNCRYGRTEIIEAENGKKKTARIIICCGYREVDPKEASKILIIRIMIMIKYG